MAAEKGVLSTVLKAMQRCVDELDGVVSRLERNPDLADYVRLNDQFHELLLDASQSSMLKRSLERLLVLPFAAPAYFTPLRTPISRDRGQRFTAKADTVSR